MNKKQNGSKPPDVTKCKSVKCNFKSTENGYCGKHQTEFKKLTLEGTTGKKVCNNHIRGCWNLIDKNIKFARCDKCREIEREKDLLKRTKTKTVNVNNDVNKRYCSTCVKPYPLSAFVGDKRQQVMTCTTCREANKRADKKRSGRSRNWTQEMQNNPERKEKKDEWKADNHDKMTQYYTKHRAKKINEKGVENVNAHNAKVAKQWRDKNKDKVVIINEQKRLDPDARYKFYKNRAENMRIEWSLTIDEFKQMITEKCHYCGYKQEGEWNGIDRKDNNKGYLKENCVTCCTMCNMIKSDIDYNRFYKMVMHIVSNLMLCELRHIAYHPECFFDSHSVLLKYYKNRAQNKNIPFALTDDQFNKLRTMKCYICGKKTSYTHLNGIDRINNVKGYEIDNCLPCCAGCNYMKKEYDFGDFIHKIYLIYCKFKKCVPQSKKNIITIADLGGYLDNIHKIFTKNTVVQKCKYTEEELTVLLSRYYKRNLRARAANNLDDVETSKNVINAINERRFDDLDKLLDNRKNITHVDRRLKENKNKGKMTTDEHREYEKLRKQAYRNKNKPVQQKQQIDKKEVDRLRKQRQREKEKSLRQGVTLTELELENIMNARALKPKKLTQDEIRERDRLRKQKQREEKLKKYNDKDYIELHSYEVALKNAIKKQNPNLIEKYTRLIEEFKKKHN
jgi:hypothetical protein